MDYMSVAGAAKALGVAGRTIRARIAAGQMHAEQVNPRLWMIPLAEVERWRAIGRLKRGPSPKRATEEPKQ
jgi:excisionase family DNA binding protein